MGQTDVVVVGAGLAGLAAGVCAAGERASVVIVDGRRPGGRAGTTRYDDGVAFNEGPHALYGGGEAQRVLRSFGLQPTGGPPPLQGARAERDGRLHPLPAGPVALSRTKLMSARSKVRLARVMGRLGSIAHDEVAGRSTSAWFDELELADDARGVVGMLVRVGTYTADHDRLPAEVALAQLRLASAHGVLYLDGGFQQLVDGLLGVAATRGVTVVDHDAVVEVAATAGGWTVRTAAGRSWSARAVVLGLGNVRACAGVLAEWPSAWSSVGPDAVAACLDLAATRRPDPAVLFGIDEPLYLSTHCPPARLAPDGVTVVEVMRYRATGEAGDPEADRAALEALLARAGVGPEDVVRSRYLHRMVAVHGIPDPAVGLAGRPAVAVPGADGLFVAGDWVGPAGWLSDASLASGEAAGLLAASAAVPSLAR